MNEVFDAVNGKTSGAFQNRYHRIAGGIVGGDLLALCECEQGNADRLILRQRLADDLTVLGIYQTLTSLVNAEDGQIVLGIYQTG